ncbi:MAG: D-alanyl-D-alanine carboxypeptidase [Alphaproteobacteria bacterium]|nr:D-alanyl-D-alanine carboxypeptidase [Alphaproteobacteria bacterium]
MSVLTACLQRLGVLAICLLVVSGLAVSEARAIETTAKAAILLDAKTGTVLFEKNADEPLPPSSMSKMMTVYLVFQRLKDGRLSLEDKLLVSQYAWRKGGSKMFVEEGKEVSIEDLLRGIIIQSGNDASIVVAEGLAGSEEAFADEMNEEGRKLGLTNSHFKNATGWPVEGQVVSARDLSAIALRTIQDFPEYYHYYAEKEFTYSDIRQTNRNPLLYAMKDADGLKTGHTEAIGYGLTASAERDGRRLILVLNGLPSDRARAQESQRLLEWGFREFGNYDLFKAGDEVDQARVWLGMENTVPLVIGNDLVLTLPRKDRKEMQVSVIYSEPVPAPVVAGAEIAKLVIKIADNPTVVVPLVAGKSVEQLGFFGRMGAALSYLLWGVSH